MYNTAVKYWWLLRKKCMLFHELHILRTPSSSLSSVDTVFMPKKKKKRKKWCFQQGRNPSNQSLLFHPAFLTTKCGFFGEHDLWHSEEKCFTGEQMSLRRCHSTAFQCGQDGSVLEVHEEKILCLKRIALVLALQYWRREVLRLGSPGYPSQLLSSPVERQRKPRPAACVCTRMHVQHLLPLVCIMLKMFSSPSLCLQWLLPTLSSVFSSPLSALAHAAFLLCLVQIWL